jgi:hypothetical protein
VNETANTIYNYIQAIEDLREEILNQLTKNESLDFSQVAYSNIRNANSSLSSAKDSLKTAIDSQLSHDFFKEVEGD